MLLFNFSAENADRLNNAKHKGEHAKEENVTPPDYASANEQRCSVPCEDRPQTRLLADRFESRSFEEQPHRPDRNTHGELLWERSELLEPDWPNFLRLWEKSVLHNSSIFSPVLELVKGHFQKEPW